MNLLGDYVRELIHGIRDGWNRFWFAPADPATLGLIRILAGSMLFYTHLIWSLDLESFFGPRGWVSPEALTRLQVLMPPQARGWSWSYLYWIHSPTVLWIAHIAALCVFLLLTLGFLSRTMAVLGYLITISYANRVAFALFGLDDINAVLALYLAIGPCGAAYSLDRLWARWKAGAPQPIEPRTDANLSIRLMQVHMCVVYLFAALGKLMGASWWAGSATWMSVANLEYQSMDMTWLAGWPILVSLLTHLTVWWELAYCVLIWPRLTRPLMLAMAIPIHLGIALFLGMPTFGVVMLIGNVAFVSPWVVRRLLDRREQWAEQGRAGGAPAAAGGSPQR
jgi:hypothetical protein